MPIHVVSPGETVASVAKLYGADERILAFDNDAGNLPALPPGMALQVVVPEITHTVKEGETLLSVSQNYGVDPQTLWRNNMFLNGGTAIYPGETLYIRTVREPLGVFMTGGYAYPFITAELLDRSLPFLSALMPFTYGFTKEGGLIPPNDGFMIAPCEIYGVSPVMHLSTLDENDVFSVELAKTLLYGPELQRKLVDSVIANMQSKGYTSLDVDFEFLGAENAGAYAEFVAYCAGRLHPYGYGVMTALAPKTSDLQPGALYEGHDYALLGEAADALLLMTYEWGYTYGPPLAVSPIGQVRKVVDYALTRIPAEKLFLGVSVYGYDFTLPYIKGVSRAESVSARRALEIAYERGAEIKYDAEAQAPYFDYYVGDTRHTVWYEDARSVDARLRLMAEKGLRGALIWSLNREGNQNLATFGSLVDRSPFNIL